MKRLLIALFAITAVMGPMILAQADPAEDLRVFQSFFQNKFSDVPFDDFSNGLYALPKAADQREQWEKIMEFPPYELDLQKGKEFWEKNGLQTCFVSRGRRIAQHYPYWDENTNMVRTMELDINECLRRKQLSVIKELKKGTMAQIVAYMKSLSRGQRVKISITSPDARDAFEEGKNFYWSKRGQLNLSCASCHIDNAGETYGGETISAGLGHGVGFPAYLTRWGELGTLHRRYAACMRQMGAAAFKAQSRQYRRLQFYEAYLQQGLPLTAPSQRP